jgi:hypothetical protein
VRVQNASDAVYLRLAGRGESVPDLDADDLGRRRVILQTDGVHILFGQQAGVTCVWQAGTVRCFIPGD